MKHLTRLSVLTIISAFICIYSVAQAGQFPISKNYTEVQTFMRQIVAAYPNNAALIEIGKSDFQNMSIEGVRISLGQALARSQPKTLVVASHHGNEYGSVEVAKGIMLDLAKNPISNVTVYVVPVLNIGGYNSRNRYERDATGAGRDPNRDYPGPCATEGPFKLKSTRALAEFLVRADIVASATLHTYYPAVVYPWGLSTHDTSTPYDSDFQKLCSMATIESKYPIGNSTELIYPADGTFEDYAFWQHGIWSLLFELGYSHSPSQQAVDEAVRVNTPGLRRFLEATPKVRAPNHAFTGKCDVSLKSLDRHDE